MITRSRWAQRQAAQGARRTAYQEPRYADDEQRRPFDAAQGGVPSRVEGRRAATQIGPAYHHLRGVAAVPPTCAWRFAPCRSMRPGPQGLAQVVGGAQRGHVLILLGALSLGLLVGWPLIVGADGAVVGKPAPGFDVIDVIDQRVSVPSQGHYMVLEWFNPECPFVRKHYGSGAMQRLQATWTIKGVVWVTIVSSAPGKQGFLTPEQARAVMNELSVRPTALMLDPEGTIGLRYGAKTTPHLFIINPEGILIYTGAIDDRPSTDPDDITGATNYVQRALEEALGGKPVSIPETKPYGCSVKYY